MANTELDKIHIKILQHILKVPRPIGYKSSFNLSYGNILNILMFMNQLKKYFPGTKGEWRPGGWKQAWIPINDEKKLYVTIEKKTFTPENQNSTIFQVDCEVVKKDPVIVGKNFEYDTIEQVFVEVFQMLNQNKPIGHSRKFVIVEESIQVFQKEFIDPLVEEFNASTAETGHFIISCADSKEIRVNYTVDRVDESLHKMVFEVFVEVCRGGSAAPKSTVETTPRSSVEAPKNSKNYYQSERKKSVERSRDAKKKSRSRSPHDRARDHRSRSYSSYSDSDRYDDRRRRKNSRDQKKRSVADRSLSRSYSDRSRSRSRDHSRRSSYDRSYSSRSRSKDRSRRSDSSHSDRSLNDRNKRKRSRDHKKRSGTDRARSRSRDRSRRPSSDYSDRSRSISDRSRSHRRRSDSSSSDRDRSRSRSRSDRNEKKRCRRHKKRSNSSDSDRSRSRNHRNKRKRSRDQKKRSDRSRSRHGRSKRSKRKRSRSPINFLPADACEPLYQEIQNILNVEPNIGYMRKYVLTRNDIPNLAAFVLPLEKRFGVTRGVGETIIPMDKHRDIRVTYEEVKRHFGYVRVDTKIQFRVCKKVPNDPNAPQDDFESYNPYDYIFDEIDNMIGINAPVGRGNKYVLKKGHISSALEFMEPLEKKFKTQRKSDNVCFVPIHSGKIVRVSCREIDHRNEFRIFLDVMKEKQAYHFLKEEKARILEEKEREKQALKTASDSVEAKENMEKVDEEKEMES